MINYYLLTKPGIILGNLITVAAGFLLASKNTIDLWLFFATLIGLSLIIASACVFNNYIDRALDKKMKRTKDRALAIGSISEINAIIFAIFLGIIGNLVLFLYTNFLTAFIADIGFFVYVVLYSIWKGRTIYSTAIGSIAGAVPPVAGYCAASNLFDIGAMILFIMLVLWQMPHFFSIAVYHFNDYVKAEIPVLPIRKGMLTTKIHMLLYILGFILASLMLAAFNYMGSAYTVVTVSTGLLWLGLCIKGFKSNNDQLWGQHMFRLSLLVIISTCFVIPFSMIS
ncbi:MAG TPA: heme o synthase [Waddliaceae bacterium]